MISKLIFVLAALVVLTTSACGDSCKADSAHPLRVCFKSAAFLRCRRQIRTVFYVDFEDWNHKYLYTISIYKGDPQRINLKAQFTSTEPQPINHLAPEDLHDLSIARSGETEVNGDYTIEVEAVYADDPKFKITERTTLSNVVYQRHVRAVIVGVSKYQRGSDKPISPSQITNLSFAATDATAVRDFLAEFFPEDSRDVFTSRLLLDEQATKQGIEQELDDAGQSDAACEGDLFIFYFSGHTFAATDSSTRWIGTWDVDPDPKNMVVAGLSYDDLFNVYLSGKKIKADKIIIFDSCFSGLKRAPSEQSPRLPSTTPGVPDQGRLEVVDIEGKLRRDILPQLPDDNEQNDTLDELKRLGPSVAVFSATNIDRQAQEGIVLSKDLPNLPGRHFVFPDELAITPTSTGHGLFTYALFAALEMQMSPTHQHPDFAGDGLAKGRWHVGECQLDLSKAFKDAEGILEDIQSKRQRPLQEFEYWAKQDPEKIHCRRQASH